jgi:hypothetical protein
MKNFTLSLALIFATGILFAQQTNLAGPSTYIKCSEFYITKKVSELPVSTRKHTAIVAEAADSVRRTRAIAYRSRFTPGPVVTDPVMQTTQGDRAESIAPLVNFDGSQEINAYPPDPNGAVGPNDFVESINSEYQVFSKTGTSLAGPVDLATLFPGTNDDGDPIVLYDRFADRWFISEFQVSTSPYKLLVAISKTNDPTGAYYVYKFSVGSNFPDYPKYSIWTDGYYATAQFGPQQIIVLERNRMLAGSPSSGMIIASLPSTPPFGGNNSLYTAPKTMDCDGALPPYGTPNYLVFFENTNSGGYSNSIVLEKLATDTTLKKITVTMADSMTTLPFNAYFSGGNLTDISQPGLNYSLDALDGTFNFRVPYMRFTGYNSVVLANTVNTGGSVGGIRWYEIRQNDTTGKWSIYQQGTYAPADGVSRWNGSICMDKFGDISLAYSVSSSGTVYPGIRYAGRLNTDPLGTMTFTEQTAINGGSTFPNGRWGDYSTSTLDPTDDQTFWHVNEYMDGSGNQNSRIFSFKFPNPLGIADIKDIRELKVYQNGGMLNVVANGLTPNEKVSIDMFDINGKQLNTLSMTPGTNTLSTSINVSSLAKGIYFVRIGNVNFQEVKKVEIN